MLPWEIKAKFILLHFFTKIMVTSLPFLSKWSFLGIMDDTRTMLFSVWLDLNNDQILLPIDFGVLFLRSLVPYWIMIHIGIQYILSGRTKVDWY